MAYRLYVSDDTVVQYDRDPEGDRLVGRITAGQPFRSSDSLAQVESWAREYLFEHPDVTVWITEEDRVLRHEWNTAVAEWKDRYGTMIVVLWVHIILLGIYVMASGFYHYGMAGLMVTAGAILLYHVVWRLGIQNEVESGVVCAILLILMLLLLPATARAREKARRPGQARGYVVDQVHCTRGSFHGYEVPIVEPDAYVLGLM